MSRIYGQKVGWERGRDNKKGLLNQKKAFMGLSGREQK